MKLLNSKRFGQKVILTLVILILLQFMVPVMSNASSGIYGVLFAPVQYLTLGIADVGTAVINSLIYGDFFVPYITLSKSEMPDSDASIFEKINYAATTGSIGWKVINKYIINANNDFSEEIQLPFIVVSPDRIFSNKISLLDVNIISPSSDNNDSIANILHKTIANMYVLLRDVVVVAFLSVLVYVGIRIVVSSTAGDKAKYKQLLMDWIIGLCLLFIMHYIMNFSIVVVNKITDLISDISYDGVQINVENVNLNTFVGNFNTYQNIIEIFNANGANGSLSWKTDFMGYFRFYAQDNIVTTDAVNKMSYIIMYMVLVIYTIIFLFQYLRRLINIIFLTLISPFVALSYPLDKISDGKAQAFNMWLKEYIYNLILQPVHYILYFVLVGSAIDLATDHPIYALVVLGFLLQAEKLIKKMFGLDKAQMSQYSPLTGAMVMQGVNMAAKKFGKGANGKSSGKNSGGAKEVNGGDNSRLRLAENRTASHSSDDEDAFINNVLTGNDDKVNNGSNYALEGGEEQEIDPQAQLWMDLGNNNTDDSNYSLSDNTVPNNIGDDYVLDDQGLAMSDLIDNTEYVDSGISGIQSYNFNDNPDNNLNISEDDDSNNKYGKRAYIGAATRLYGPKLAKSIGKGTVKGALKITGAATLGAVGLAAGIASDDYKNVLTYGAAGIAGGNIIGDSMVNKAINTSGNIYNGAQKVNDNVIKEMYKNDPKGYKEYLNKQSDYEFLRNKQIKQQYAEAFGKDNARQMMEAAIKYREHGVTDNDLIIKTMKQSSPSLGTKVNDDRRIVAAKLASNVNNEKDLETVSKRLKQKGVTDNKVKEQEDIIRNIRGLI